MQFTQAVSENLKSELKEKTDASSDDYSEDVDLMCCGRLQWYGCQHFPWLNKVLLQQWNTEYFVSIATIQ